MAGIGSTNSFAANAPPCGRSGRGAEDLRSFSRRNQGCVWELEQLLIEIPLNRVLFAVDETTDQQFLEEKLQEMEPGPARFTESTGIESDVSAVPCAVIGGSGGGLAGEEAVRDRHSTPA